MGDATQHPGLSRLWLVAAAISAAGRCRNAWAQDPNDPFSNPGAIAATDSGVRQGASRREVNDQVQIRYRKILPDWAGGETDRAPNELIGPRDGGRERRRRRTRKRLLKAEQAVIHQVGAADIGDAGADRRAAPRGLPAHARARRQGPLAAMVHTRKMARDLAVLYKEQSGSEGAALVSSRMLTSLGGMLQQSAQQLPAAEMFQQAVELDARNTAALLGLATIYEKNAQSESAVRPCCAKPWQPSPSNAEAKLRLALNPSGWGRPTRPEGAHRARRAANTKEPILGDPARRAGARPPARREGLAGRTPRRSSQAASSASPTTRGLYVQLAVGRSTAREQVRGDPGADGEDAGLPAPTEALLASPLQHGPRQETFGRRAQVPRRELAVAPAGARRRRSRRPTTPAIRHEGSAR